MENMACIDLSFLFLLFFPLKKFIFSGAGSSLLHKGFL